MNIREERTPLPLGDVAYHTLTDSFGRMKGRDGRCKEDMAGERILSIDEDDKMCRC
jgi:hypothetical protein